MYLDSNKCQTAYGVGLANPTKTLLALSQTDRHTGRQTDRQTDRQTYRKKTFYRPPAPFAPRDSNIPFGDPPHSDKYEYERKSVYINIFVVRRLSSSRKVHVVLTFVRDIQIFPGPH